LRSGKDYLDSLEDGRQVYVGGEKVSDVAHHPAYRAAAVHIASLYDFARDPEQRDLMTYQEPDGRRYHRMWQVPTSGDDLVSRRRAHEAWQELTFGLMGRTPDHVSAFLCGFKGGAGVFARGGPEYGDHVRAYYAYARDRDLYVAYAIVPPQGDRSKSASQQSRKLFYAGVAAERDGGIVVQGAQGIATGAVIADAVVVTSIVPLRPGDEDYAISVVIPMDAPGLKIYPRLSYASSAGNSFDYPLSSRFDETDSMIILDDVFVPWEHVFIYRNVELCQAQFFETAAHSLGNFQALIRLSVKLRFALAIVKRICEVHGTDKLPPVQSSLGQLAAYASAIKAFVRAAEANPQIDQSGVARPDVEMVYGGLVLQPLVTQTMMQMVRELAGGGMIALPSSVEMFTSPVTSEDVNRFFVSGDVSAVERVKLLKLAWDLVGTEFGGRQHQYEMFYAGAPFLTQLRNYLVYDWSRPRQLLESFLNTYSLPEIKTTADVDG
jgi:4-hydroxyphenylacetate 3-monooxygenase